MNLDDLIPETGTFRLDKFPDVEFQVQKISLDDEAWLSRTWKPDEFKALWEKGELMEICRIAFHQMPVEQKQLFKMQQVTGVDEEGNEQKMQLGGVNLFRMCIHGLNEKAAVMKAVLMSIGASRLIEKANAEATEEQKKSLEKLKQNREKLSPSKKSSTSSRANTGGRSSKSGR